MWAGVLGGGWGVILQETVLLSTFGAFIMSSSFLGWRWLFVHLLSFQGREHIGCCRCIDRSLSVTPSVKMLRWVWMQRIQPYTHVSVFRLLLSHFCFCEAELGQASHHCLLSFWKAGSPRPPPASPGGEVRLESGSLTRFFVKGSKSHFSHFHQGGWIGTASHFKS